MSYLYSRPISVLLVFSIIACSAMCNGPLRAAEVPGAQSTLNDGYSLFYDFCKQESQLSLLMWIKRTPPGVKDYAERVASAARDDMASLKKMAASESTLRLEKTPLPPFENSVRTSMAEDRKQLLVWDLSGSDFARALVMSQSETTNYGLHVAKVLATTEPDPSRARIMQKIYRKWLALHNETRGLVSR